MPTAENDVDLEFSISHSDAAIVVAISLRALIGIDTETVEAIRLAMPVARDFLTSRELADLNRFAGSSRERRLLRYWTAKECYSKARGVGLSLPLHSYFFELRDDNGMRLHVGDDDPGRWRFYQLKLNGTHLISICQEQATAEVPEVRIARYAPFQVPLSMHFELVGISAGQFGGTRVGGISTAAAEQPSESVYSYPVCARVAS